MKSLKLYHGSTDIIEKPIFGFGKTDNDYGQGFYCTEDERMAKEWACRDNRDGYSNEYRLDLSDMVVLDLNDADHNLLQWAAVLVSNRRFSDLSPVGTASRRFLLEHCLPDISGYDVIRGYRADDSYFAYTTDFLNGTIPYDIFSAAMHLGKLGEQVVLKSRKAFDRLKFKGCEEARYSEFHQLYGQRELTATESYMDMRRDWEYSSNDILMPDILSGRVGLDDERLQ